MLGCIAFADMLCEGAAADWAAVYLRNSLHTVPLVAGLAYAAYALAMLTVRLAGNRLFTRFAASRLLPLLAALATLGFAAGLVIARPVSVLMRVRPARRRTRGGHPGDLQCGRSGGQRDHRTGCGRSRRLRLGRFRRRTGPDWRHRIVDDAAHRPVPDPRSHGHCRRGHRHGEDAAPGDGFGAPNWPSITKSADKDELYGWFEPSTISFPSTFTASGCVALAVVTSEPETTTNPRRPPSIANIYQMIRHAPRHILTATTGRSRAQSGVSPEPDFGPFRQTSVIRARTSSSRFSVDRTRAESIADFEPRAQVDGLEQIPRRRYLGVERGRRVHLG